jgi:N-glycosylase/DNA lyase
VSRFHLGHTLGSGQLFRWGRDEDGWWKGMAYGTAFHLRQQEESLLYRASSDRVATRAGRLDAASFLRWYLRTDEAPRLRVPRWDSHLRQARDRLRGFRFARQEPFECTLSYVLSTQAHMSLTKKRINWIARILGSPVDLRGERYWTFPGPAELAPLNGAYFKHHRFGWRSTWVAETMRAIREEMATAAADGRDTEDLVFWRPLLGRLRSRPNTGIGLKVAKCIDLFALERMGAVPVDTWVLKMARDWYGIEGTDARVCAWAEERGKGLSGYMNEYLFITYREQNAPAIHDRVISFCEQEAPSPELPFEKLEV